MLSNSTLQSYALAEGMQCRIVIGVEYNGAQMHGWQRQAQPEVTTVQAELEKALTQVANHPVALVCAGRTDAGVHAVQQVAHFDVAVDRPNKAWVRGVNAVLPRSIRVLWATPVETTFHARFSATARRYQYWIQNTAVASAIFNGGITHYPHPLDEKRMHLAAQNLLGEQDFTSFRAASCQSRTAMRNVQKVQVTRQGQRLCIDIQANAFLLHMVRNITGTLLAIGQGQQSTDWVAELMQQKNRALAAPTAKPHGLYLYQVTYPQLFNLPNIEPQLMS